MMRKVSNPIAAIFLLALAAGTAIHLCSWRAEHFASTWEYSSTESQRKLEHVSKLAKHHESSSFFDKIWRDRQRKEHTPDPQKVEAIIRNRVSKEEDIFLHELEGHYNSASAFEHTWHSLVKSGKSPGTPLFKRMLKNRLVRRERRQEREMLKKLDQEARTAKRELLNAKMKLKTAMKRMKNVEKPKEVGEAKRRLGGSRKRNFKDKKASLQGDVDVKGTPVATKTEEAPKIEEEVPMNKDDHYNVEKSLMEAKIQLEEAAKKLENVVQSQENGKGETKKQLKVLEETLESAAEIELQEVLEEEDYRPLVICDRNADVGSTEDFAALQKYAQCTPINRNKPILLLEGYRAYGLTGNNLIEFLHAIQEARDMDIQLGIMYRSWATRLLLKMWMAIDSDDWQAQFERTFCVKIFKHKKELEGWNVFDQDPKELYYYTSKIPLEDYVASQEYSIRSLFHNYNTGDGKDISGAPVKDMCSGINAIFGKDQRSSAMYSVIHSRSLEGEPGVRLLGNLANRSGCDPVAALEMKPDYIKAILKPLGMMKHPIVFITDGQNPAVLERLLADPDLGPMIRTVPEEACWIGGDLTLAIMSNAFIGNPASTFTGFIAKSRLALGFGHNYLFRARYNYMGQWKEVCGDHCIFDKSIMNVMS